MYPHERSLVKRLEGKSFVLLGVNSDSDRDQLKKTLVEEQITWRSWWDQGSIEGPIQTQWQVTARPMVYILDADGIIRAKDVTGKNVDETVEKLVAELESKTK
jgi:hypothetical protein